MMKDKLATKIWINKAQNRQAQREMERDGERDRDREIFSLNQLAVVARCKLLSALYCRLWTRSIKLAFRSMFC